MEDAFGNPLTKCEFWCCNEHFRLTPGRRFCSRGCKQADSKRRSRAADPTRARRKAAGKALGARGGDLYVIRAGRDPIIKVGYSKSVQERLRILQTAHYHKLEVLSTLPAKMYFQNAPPDKVLHELLPDEDHVRGEWWVLTPKTRKVLQDFGFDIR